ncbi:MAG: M48 family metalloprotease [Bryobacteraceae bacterium]|nr:M48 family metallopeptidase [Bryobacterales bacterium]MEB2362214.1 M48 family metallopeptidase [Bryobacterales bacterium]NUN00884.1 M48 family metalloprotease [Bryobacteraceae bacterium]
MQRVKALLVVVSFTLNAFVPAAWARDARKDPDMIGERDIAKGVNFYSIEKEMALGKQLAEEVERQSRVVDDPVVSEYVNRLGQNLVRNSDAKVPFTIKVLDSGEVNAFALPGGYLFVNTGLIERTESEAQLAGVLAHEIAHVAARHGTRQATRGRIINIATIPLIFMGGWAGYIANQAAGIAVPLGFLKFSRGFEEEADLYGIQYLYKAGYDPTAFVDFFEKLQTLEKKKPGTLAKVFSSHPMTGDRIKDAQEYMSTELAPREEYVVTTSEYEEVKARVEALDRRRIREEDPDRPTLRRRSSGTIDTGGEQKPDDEDERPTLKRQ